MKKEEVLCIGSSVLCDGVLCVSSMLRLLERLCEGESIRVCSSSSSVSLKKCMLNVPRFVVGSERYINPLYRGWESRYYKMLFVVDVSDVCVNYIEGLEWVYKYYTGDCVDWKWRYKENYAPLLVDCVKYLKSGRYVKLCEKKNEAFNEGEALKYVMPPENPSGPFEWAFCKYFWECHPLYSDDIYKEGCK